MIGSVEFLREGTTRQQQAYYTLLDLEIFTVLAKYSPVLTGTIPIDLDVDSSDLDIVCEAHDLDEFESVVSNYYGAYQGFETDRTESMGVPALVCNFEAECFPIEIFAQAVPVHRQRAYLHMVAESRLLHLAGDDAKRALRILRGRGMKTEPAFGEYFCLSGDPYERLYEMADATDQELLAVINAAAISD